MMSAPRIVLDANVFASSLIQPKGFSGQILEEFVKKGTVQVVISASILAETRRCLFYPRVRKRIRASDDEIEAYMHSIAILSDVVEPTDEWLGVVKADPDDDKYIAVAIEGLAEYLVSGDRHLLDIGEYEGVKVVTPAEFVRLRKESTAER